MANSGGDVSKASVPDNVLLVLSGKIGGEWKNIARFLGLADPTISHISQNNLQNVQEQIYQMLVFWKKSKGQYATYNVLTDALRQASRNDLADDLTPYHVLPSPVPDDPIPQKPTRGLSKEEAFRGVLVEIANTLGPEDVERIVFQCPQIPQADKASIKDGVRLFDKMRRYGILSVVRLEELLEKSKLVEPLSLLENFKKRYE